MSKYGYIVLGVIVLVILVYAYFEYSKKFSGKEDNKKNDKNSENNVNYKVLEYNKNIPKHIKMYSKNKANNG